VRHRRKYFIGVLDPCAPLNSREAAMGLFFLQRLAFYGRSYRMISPDKIVETGAGPKIGISSLTMCFIQGKHGPSGSERRCKKGIKEEILPGDAPGRITANKDVFKFWKSIGLQYMFLGVEAIDEEGC